MGAVDKLFSWMEQMEHDVLHSESGIDLIKSKMDSLLREESSKSIKLTCQEIDGGIDRVDMAERLIVKLPTSDEGRNLWLAAFGKSDEAKRVRVSLMK